MIKSNGYCAGFRWHDFFAKFLYGVVFKNTGNAEINNFDWWGGIFAKENEIFWFKVTMADTIRVAIIDGKHNLPKDIFSVLLRKVT